MQMNPATPPSQDLINDSPPSMVIQIYGLYVYWSESMETPYLMCVSCSEEKLKEILKNINKEQNWENWRTVESHEGGVAVQINDEGEDGTVCTYKIKPVDVYVVSIHENNKILFNKVSSYNEEFIKDKIYGMNITKVSGFVDQVLLKIFCDSKEGSLEYNLFMENLRKHPLFVENNFSSNSIKFDEYYDEGILNA